MGTDGASLMRVIVTRRFGGAVPGNVNGLIARAPFSRSPRRITPRRCRAQRGLTPFLAALERVRYWLERLGHVRLWHIADVSRRPLLVRTRALSGRSLTLADFGLIVI
jgi:hypothetical protein